MKKSIFASFVAVFMLLISTQIQAQALEQWTWKDYNLSFSIPKGFKVETSTGKEFSGKCESSKIHFFSITPYQDSKVTEENLKEAIGIMAKEAKMRVSETKHIEFNGFKGYYAEGTIEGLPAFFCCILNPNDDNNFIITILHENTDAAVKVIKSIKPM
ncbi:MAG: hypothetical protein OHK0038_18890 [Flammeovirgaceae bacterium]